MILAQHYMDFLWEILYLGRWSCGCIVPLELLKSDWEQQETSTRFGGAPELLSNNVVTHGAVCS